MAHRAWLPQPPLGCFASTSPLQRGLQRANQVAGWPRGSRRERSPSVGAATTPAAPPTSSSSGTSGTGVVKTRPLVVQYRNNDTVTAAPAPPPAPGADASIARPAAPAPAAKPAAQPSAKPVPQVAAPTAPRAAPSLPPAAASTSAAAGVKTAILTAPQPTAPPPPPAPSATTAPAAQPAATPTSSDDAAPQSPEAALAEHKQLKVIGMGLRGISAVNRLMDAGAMPEAEFWAIDCDKRALAGAGAHVRTLEVPPGDEVTLGQEELASLAGAAPSAAARDAPDGHAGAVFVLGSAFGSPGGSHMLLQLVRHLRRQGYFVAAALTRPFDFEGARRLEAADALIGAIEEVAHLAVVISQGVLTRASADLTMAQAQAIADNTLVYTVQSTMWALRAPEVLKVSRGAYVWHGRDLRAIKRPLFPPMMNLLSCPGHATLGRGQAALPLPLLQQAGLASALSTLAEDAVQAAAESPFLDDKLDSATGVLCVLRVPPSILGVAAAPAASAAHGGPLVADNHKEYALRTAVKVAAMTVRELVGPHCHDIIVCPQLCHSLEHEHVQRLRLLPGQDAAAGGEAGSAGSAAAAVDVEEASGPLARLEVSLLVLEAIEEAAETKAIVGSKPSPSAASTDAASATTIAATAGAAPSSPPPPVAAAAATARDRMASVVRPASIRRAPSARMLSVSNSVFGLANRQAQQQQQQQLVVQPAPVDSGSDSAGGGTQPAWAGSAASSPPARPAGASPSRTAAVPAAAAPPPPPGGPSAPARAPAGAAPATAPAAASAAAAASNNAKKAARLAAMSALAGGSAAAVHNSLGAGSARGSGGPVLVGVNAVPGTWTGATNARGQPMGQAAQEPVLLQPHGPQQQQPAAPPEVAAPEADAGGFFGLQQIPRLAESMVTSLVAQSLDLPPQAARWRHQRRAPPPNRASFELPTVEEELPGASQTEGEGLGRGLQQLIARFSGGGDGVVPPPKPAAVMRSRVAGMLDREHSWSDPLEEPEVMA